MKKTFLLIGLAFTLVHIKAQKPSGENIQLPKIFSNHMVLQQQEPIRIFGTADPKGTVVVRLNDHKTSTKVDKTGKWLLELPAMEAGGPFELRVKGKSQEILFRDVLIGEVWFCSGQSNMQWDVSRAKNADKEIANANYPEIRLFTVPKETAVLPADDLSSGKWEICSPATVADFSAVAYYFGRKLHKDLNVPVGLINSSWGGTEVEAWTSIESIKEVDAFADEIKPLFTLTPSNFKEQQKKFNEEWISQTRKADTGYKNGEFVWAAKELNTNDWEIASVSTPVESIFKQEYDGITWFRFNIQLTVADLKADSLYLSLGSVDDEDITFVNGVAVGETINDYRKFRIYPIHSKAFTSGENLIAVRIKDYHGGAGFGSDPDKIILQTVEREISLSGEWKAKIGAISLPPKPEGMLTANRPNELATSLYNGMVAPVIPYTIQGAIWYQGEANAGEFSRARQYATLFPLLIKDWRQNWELGDFPFLFVQLANFLAPDTVPKDDPWPFLRESQLNTLQVPNTAMASAIDIGEEKSIHPLNKQDVGARLALGALKLAYNEDIDYMGPMYESIEIEEDTALVAFSHSGTGLEAHNKYGYLMGFAVAGQDSVFHYAQARIVSENEVKVWSNKVEEIVALRYGWANNPEMANLYNSAGLPATPFRTDQWPPKK